MRVAIIGGTGHIGSYLTPRLFDAGHTVICVSRGLKTPYREHAAWRAIERLELDRAAEEAAGTFGERMARLRDRLFAGMAAQGVSEAVSEQVYTAPLISEVHSC